MTYPDPSSLFRLELAFGADPDGPPSSWSWTDVTADLDGSQTIQISRGNADEQSNLSPSEAAVLLRNEDGKYTPNDPRSPHWPHVVDGVPARLSYDGSVRLVGRVASIEPEWPHGDLSQTADLSAPAWELGVARVRMVISGITRWISRPGGALESPLRRHITSAYGDLLVAYLPLEDGEDTRLAEAAVPGQTPLAYNMSEGRAPRWARDDSCPGSAPLPEWPVGGYISWSDGSQIAGSGGPPWAVLMAVRVPPGSGEAWLCEWRTNGGTWSRWSLKVTSGGALQVVASDSDASPETVTYTSTLGVDDGRWHAVSVWVHLFLDKRVIIRRDNDEEEFFTVGATVGAIRAFRPRPVFADPTDKAPIGLGHAFVLVDSGTSWIPGERQRHIPVDGWSGEPAVDRFERLAVEGGIPYRLILPVLARDQFDRTVPDGWGTADLGGEWQTLDNAFSVSAGEGVISTSGLGSHAHLSEVTVTDVDMRASVMASDQRALSYLTVRDGPDYTYTVELWQFDGTVHVDIWRQLNGQWEQLASFFIGEDIDPGQRWWIRAQVRGDRIRGKAWVVGEPEPDWQAEAHDRAIPSGWVGVTSESLTSGSVTFWWRDITVSATPNNPCGVQQRAELLDLLQEAADVDGGILHETRDEPGYTLRTLVSLVNQDPAVTLDAAAGGGEVTAPFAPVLDDQHRLNDATAKRPEGGAARVVDAEHASRHGRSAGEVQVRVAHDRQLPSYAGWAVHLGTWPEMRIPVISPALDTVPGLVDRWLPVDIGDRIDVTNLPPQYPGRRAELVVRGSAESYTPTRMAVDANTTPYGPLRVLKLGDPVYGRLDTGGSELGSSIDDDDTTLTVVTTGLRPWIATATHPDEFPFAVLIGDVEVARVTAVAGASSPQTFTVERGVNGIARAWPAGTSVRLANPVVLGL